MHQIIYFDKYRYYLGLDGVDNSLCVKLSVLSRFLIFFFKNTRIFMFSDTETYLASYYSALRQIHAAFYFTFKRRLKFHGLAFGVDVAAQSRNLLLNVGYTGMQIVKIPSYISNFCINKAHRKLVVESRMIELVANFVSVIRDIRPMYVYFNPAKRGGRRGIRLHLSVVRRKKFKKDVK